jgi:hypothetical protein
MTMVVQMPKVLLLMLLVPAIRFGVSWAARNHLDSDYRSALDEAQAFRSSVGRGFALSRDSPEHASASLR